MSDGDEVGTVVAVDGEGIIIEADGEKRELMAADVVPVIARPPEFSDEALALKFAERHADHLRYVAPWGRWYSWNGRHWCADDTLLAFDRVRALCREEAETCGEPKRVAAAIASAKTVAAVERLARSDRRLAATVEQWDADPWLLNTPAGVVDLRTGKLRRGTPGDYITKCTAVAPDDFCPIPMWSQFMADVTSGDTEVEEFLQRAVGYGLTGVTREHALFFLFGTGSNGKSTFIDTVTGCIGDGYHRVAAIETFTVTNTHQHPTVLASLHGSRIVTASETEEGRRWAESKLKMLTGGDKITAYFMRRDPFDFLPQFKLFIFGNHRPALRTVDAAIRRRFYLVHFRENFREMGVEDQNLPERLRDEWPGILAWTIKGCLEWQRIGLAAPAAVRAATDSYLEAQDVFSAWRDERCESVANAWEPLADLYADLKAWGDRNGEFVGRKRAFSEKLEYHFEPKRGTGGAAGFLGVQLKRAAGGGDEKIVPV